MGALFLTYCILFWKSLNGHWFDPNWTTDDALQQLYPFYKVFHPDNFAGDYITKMMECYLAPMHYWISWIVTWMTGDPIMMGHWLMFAQLASTLAFVFLAVRYAAGAPAAFLSAIWMLHTRHIVQRMTAGLPRGWSATILSGFVYFLLLENHRLILAWLFVGCLLHTPSTLICAVTYGLFLVWRTVLPSTRDEYRPRLLTYVLLSPVYLVVVFSVVQMPADIGRMATYAEAKALPEFQRALPETGISEGGRFPYVPLNSIGKEIRFFAFQAFVGRFDNPAKAWKSSVRPIAIGLLIAFVLVSLVRRVKILPTEFYFYLMSVCIVYWASRILAFRLYVPDRHLQFPMAIFFVTAYPIAAWRLFSPKLLLPALSTTANRSIEAIGMKTSWRGFLGITLLGLLVYSGSGLSLSGSANFNYAKWKRGQVFEWIRKNTPPGALVAGAPTALDPVQLFGMRKGYVTTETSHPFFDKYRDEMRRRLEITFRALYAPDIRTMRELLKGEKIDYFLFEKELFYPEKLQNARYFPPQTALIRQLTARPYDEYAYRKLPAVIRKPMTADASKAFPFLAYWDNRYVLIDVNKLPEGALTNGGEVQK